MFSIDVRDELLNRLSQFGWWRDILAYRYNGKPLFIALRDGYISVYINGRAIFKKIELSNHSINALFDRRYSYDPSAKSGDLIFDGLILSDKVAGEDNIKRRVIKDGAKIIQELENWVPRIANYGLVNLSDEAITASKKEIGEKECLAEIAVRPECINLEMALRGFKNPADKRIAPRIDMVQLERNGDAGINCVFTEAKLYSNKRSLRVDGDSEPRVVSQVFAYRTYLETNYESVKNAYVKCCKILVRVRREQQIGISDLILEVADGAPLVLEILPRVLVFNEPPNMSDFSKAQWQSHRDKITSRGIKLEVVQAQG